MAGDAFPDVLVSSLDALPKVANGQVKLNLIKLPHHGSKHNVTTELLEKVECHNYMISKSGAKFKHPSKEAIAKIIKYGGDKCTIWFNYESPFTKVWKNSDLTDQWDYQVKYAADDAHSIRLKLN